VLEWCPGPCCCLEAAGRLAAAREDEGEVVLSAELSDVSFAATGCGAQTVGLWARTIRKSQAMHLNEVL